MTDTLTADQIAETEMEMVGLRIQIEEMMRISAAQERGLSAALEVCAVAETEVARYRKLAVRLAETMHSLVFEDNSDEYLVVREARLLFEDPDIAALLKESRHE